MQAYHARDMSSEPALRRSLGLAGGWYEMIITLSRREPKPLETCGDSGALERALPIRARPSTRWKRALQSQPCAHRTRGDRFGLTRRRGADRGCGLQATMPRPACADQPTSGALHEERACRAAYETDRK